MFNKDDIYNPKEFRRHRSFPKEIRTSNLRSIHRGLHCQRSSSSWLSPMCFFILGVFATLIFALKFPLVFVEILSRFLSFL